MQSTQQKAKGFTLVELLLVSLLGSLVLIASSQSLGQLLSWRSHNQTASRVQEQLLLAESAIKQHLQASTQLLEYGAATDNYPNLGHKDYTLQTNGDDFKQFASSDWLVLERAQGKSYLLHLDKKTYDFGLAVKIVKSNDEAENENRRSEALVSYVELMRLRFFCAEQQRWVNYAELNNPDNLSALQVGLVLVSANPVKRLNQSQLKLWGASLMPPQDGHYRALTTFTAFLGKPDAAHN